VPNNSQLLAPGDYAAMQAFLQDSSGIMLGEGKEYLVTSRLGRLMRERDIATVGDLIAKLKTRSDAQLFSSFIDAMTTNETFWFRDQVHFDMLVDTVLPELKGSVRLWSAACSSGQESYNLAMCVHDYLAALGSGKITNATVLGTDISSKILEEARRGIYCGLSASRGMTTEQQQRYFIVRDDCLEVRPAIKQRVNFRELNLTERFDALGKFDVIFCRNVLIYFSIDQKADIINRFADSLNPGGFLFLGSTESLSAHSDRFEMVNSNKAIGYRLIA
jgi:chemotaxis protein methyltransferase CheR